LSCGGARKRCLWFPQNHRTCRQHLKGFNPSTTYGRIKIAGNVSTVRPNAINKTISYKTISSSDAKRQFSRVLLAVEKGNSYVVTSHGRPVARIVPFTAAKDVAGAARSTLLARLRSQRVVDVDRSSPDYGDRVGRRSE
jgi:prevent-host-death family protein